ncbi:MAG: assimilatory sulfite reductase (NADPH) flavoprotein subunit [Candidatus Pristimantibacillus sp.]
MQLQVTNSPFNQEQVELLNRLLPSLTETQQIWISGYLSALSRSALTGAEQHAAATAELGTVATLSSVVSQPVGSREVTILFGSQTGNCQRLAGKLSRKLEEQGYQVSLAAMNTFKPNGLKKVENLLILASTHGEGDPPDNAISFHEFIYSKRAPQLESLWYSVLSLGDTSYEFFCKTGKDFDQRLEELGGQRLSPRVDCDLDYDEPAAEWFDNVISALNQRLNASATAATVSVSATGSGTMAEQSIYSRTNPFKAEVLANINLNGRGSDRETRHLELSLEGSNLQYEPGDCLGICPENHPELVNSLIEAMGWKADELVPINKKGEERTLLEALSQHYEITVLTKPLVEQIAQITSSAKLRELLSTGHEQELKSYIAGRDLLDLVQELSPWQISARDFVAILRKLPARLYSIASSFKANPDEVHLTIRAVRYESHGRDRYGVCSVQCAERLQPGDTLPIYIQHNPNFKLPVVSDTPVIMIGPGTGVAPFRAFLEEREELGAEGKTWLFYGDRHFVTDFLYQTDWQRMLKDGALTRLDVAFSRDTEEKVYVQNRLIEKSREIFQWLQEGAHVYICGDEKHMAHDVHAALISILESEGKMSHEEATAYLAEMQQQQRYQRDVY